GPLSAVEGCNPQGRGCRGRTGSERDENRPRSFLRSSLLGPAGIDGPVSVRRHLDGKYTIIRLCKPATTSWPRCIVNEIRRRFGSTSNTLTRDDIARLRNFAWLLDVSIRHRADVHQPVLVDSHINEGAERGDVHDRPCRCWRCSTGSAEPVISDASAMMWQA